MPFLEFLQNTPSRLFLTELHFVIVLGIALRVMMKKPTIGVALSWLFIVSSLPYVGALLYLMVGERRVTQHRVRQIEALRTDYKVLIENAVTRGLLDVDWDRHPPVAKGLHKLGLRLASAPTVAGSTGDLYSDTQEVLKQIAEDIRNADHSVLMEFYIWNEGGAADEVLEALIEAAKRGVACRVLVDDVGARPWWRGNQPQQLLDAGVLLRKALPAGIKKFFLGRNDLRLHRKIVVIDSTVAWTGSMNMVDPDYFKQTANVGKWIDAMVRVEGALVGPLAVTMISDWLLESGEDFSEVLERIKVGKIVQKGDHDAQVIPSGPGESDDALLQMIILLINSASDHIIVTTPYFIPDQPLLLALRGAAARGVNVEIVLPRKVDSLMTHFASRSYYQELLDVGVSIHLFTAGLLHTKSITVDNKIAMFGTANLDMRSLWLNYEVSIFAYSEEFTRGLTKLQQEYIAESIHLNSEKWMCRPFVQRFLENFYRLFSPLL